MPATRLASPDRRAKAPYFYRENPRKTSQLVWTKKSNRPKNTASTTEVHIISFDDIALSLQFRITASTGSTPAYAVRTTPNKATKYSSPNSVSTGRIQSDMRTPFLKQS